MSVKSAVGGAFEQALVIPTKPEHFVISPLLEKVGETLVTEQTIEGSLGLTRAGPD